jgi:hypothetical protein
MKLHNQLLGRGTARKVRYGVGGECHVRVYDETDFARFLGSLPNVDWKVLPRVRFLVGVKERANAEVISRAIVRFLRKFDGDAISVRKLKAELKLGKASNDTFQRAREVALAEMPHWLLVGQTLQRAG